MSIDINELRIILRLNGIDDSKYTDDDLEHLINYFTQQFNSLICFKYIITNYEEYYALNESVKVLLINHYPIQSLDVFMINNEDGLSRISWLEKDKGILYFKEPVMGDLNLIYHAGWNDEDIERIIKPIIIDLLIYGVKYGKEKFISSISEGDVSITYNIDDDTKDTLYIDERIKALNKRFCVKARMIG